MHFISCICTCVNFHLLKKAHRPNKENLCTKYSIHGQYWYKLCKDIFSLNYMETVQFLQDLKSDSTFFIHFSGDFTTFLGILPPGDFDNIQTLSIWNQFGINMKINMKLIWNQHEINMKSTRKKYEIMLNQY